MDYLSSFTGEAGCQRFTVLVVLLFEQEQLVCSTQEAALQHVQLWPVAGCGYHGSASSHTSLPHNLALAGQQCACASWTPKATNTRSEEWGLRARLRLPTPVLHGCIWVTSWSKIPVCSFLTGLLLLIFALFQLISACFHTLWLHRCNNF